MTRYATKHEISAPNAGKRAKAFGPRVKRVSTCTYPQSGWFGTIPNPVAPTVSQTQIPPLVAEATGDRFERLMGNGGFLWRHESSD